MTLTSSEEPSLFARETGKGGGVWLHAALVATVFLLVALPFLGGPPLFDPDEGYYPQTAREMLGHGNWLDPVFNGGPRWEKPVGFYLAECLSFRLLGVSEWTARFPSLLAGLGLALLTLGLGRSLYGSRTGLYAGLLSATAVQPAVYSRAAVPDMLLSFFVTLALFAYARLAVRTPGSSIRRWQVLLGAAAGLGFLVKGPLGVILPGITIAAYLTFSRDLKGALRLNPALGLAVFLLVAGPWYVYMTRLHGAQFLDEHFLQRNLERYFTNRWQHPGPLYYYLPILLAGAFPWSVAFIEGLAGSFRGARGSAGSRENGGLRNPDLFVLCWLLGMLVFFSFSRSKLPNYVLPLYPAVLLLAARRLTALETLPVKSGMARIAWSTATLSAVFIFAGVTILPAKIAETQGTVLFWLSPLTVIAAMAPLYQRTRSLKLWLAGCMAGMALFLSVLTGAAIPRLDRLQAVRTLSREHLRHLPDLELVAQWDAWSPSLLFYSGKGAIRYNPDTESRDSLKARGVRWIFTSESALGEIEKAAGGPPPELYRKGGRVLLRLAD